MSQPTRRATSRPSASTPAAPAASATGGTGGRPPYGFSARVADWVQARADGRAGLPSLEPGRPAGTPTLETLAQDFLARSHRERLRVDVETTPLMESAAQLGTRIEEAERAVARAAEVLGRWPALLDAEQLAQRRGGETLTAPDVVAARRAREYEAQRRPLADQEATLRQNLSAMRVELARVRSAVRARELVGATRVRRLHAQIMRRISAYERHLVRRHPAGDRIGGVLAAQHPRVPGWVLLAEAAADSATPTAQGPPGHERDEGAPVRANGRRGGER